MNFPSDDWPYFAGESEMSLIDGKTTAYAFHYSRRSYPIRIAISFAKTLSASKKGNN